MAKEYYAKAMVAAEPYIGQAQEYFEQASSGGTPLRPRAPCLLAHRPRLVGAPELLRQGGGATCRASCAGDAAAPAGQPAARRLRSAPAAAAPARPQRRPRPTGRCTPLLRCPGWLQGMAYVQEQIEVLKKKAKSEL
jgi:hypothetical protein